MTAKFRTIRTNSAPEAIGPYSQAVIAGNFVYVSGQLGLEPKTGKLARGIEAQTRQAMENVGEILKSAGLDYSNIVKAEIFLADINDFASVNKIYAEFLAEPYPARAAMEVANLPKGGLVEIAAVAIRS